MICFAGCLPPPTHGMANVNAMVVARLLQRDRVRVFPVMKGARAGIVGHTVKLARAVRAVAGIVTARLAGARAFYGSVDDNLGALYTCAFALVARLCGMQVFLHHHSFLYIDRNLPQIRLLTRLAGPGACHVTLCRCMAEKFRARYPAVRSTMSVPNAIEIPAQPAGLEQERRGPLTIGLLSNLSFEKGVDEFIRLIEEARSRNLEVQGILAGPAANPEALARIERAQTELGPALAWWGPVHGADKERFFAHIDIFVFPTRYRTEAYPLVLVEALVRGVPVISIERGCIGELGTLASCTVHPQNADFVSVTLPQLAAWLDNPAALREARMRASRDGETLHNANRAAMDALVDAVVAAGWPDA